MIKISGRVIKGDRYGKKLGFPTANLERRNFSRRKIRVRLGIYAGWAQFKLKAKSYKLKAGIVIGPLDNHRIPKIEAHLLNFKGNLYGKKITIILQKYLRPFRKFKTVGELKGQIKKDIKKIKKS